MVSQIMKLTTSIVTSHLSNNKMPHSDVVSFLETVFNKMEALDAAYIQKHGLDKEEGGEASPRPSADHIAPEPIALAAAPSGPQEEAHDAITPAPRKRGRPRSVPVVAEPAAEKAEPLHKTATEAPRPIPARATRKPAAAPQFSLRKPEDQVDAERWPGVYPDKIVCLEDQAETTLLRAYVKNRFGMSFDEYKEKWNLPADYPNAPPEYAEKKRASAKQVGLGTSLRPKKKAAAAIEPTRKPGTLSPKYAHNN